MDGQLYRAEVFTASDGFPGLRLVPLPEGSAVIPVEALRLAAQAVEAFAVSPYGNVGLAALARVLDDILRAARGGAS